MSHDAWTFFGVLVVQGAGVLIVYLKLRKQRADVHKAATAAEEAVVLSRPTGNGWSQRVDTKLDHLIRITAETRQLADETRQGLQDHVTAHVAASLEIPIRATNRRGA